jgi:hypothetical protein
MGASLAPQVTNAAGQALSNALGLPNDIGGQAQNLGSQLLANPAAQDIARQILAPMLGMPSTPVDLSGVGNALSPQARIQLGQNLEQANVPVVSGLLGSMLQSPSLLDSMQTVQDLTNKYAGTPGSGTVHDASGNPLTIAVDPNVMTPEDRAAYNQAMFAVGGLETPGGMFPEELAGAGNINLAKYPAEVQDVIQAAATSIPESATRGVIPDTVIRQLAQLSGTSVPDIVANWRPGQAQNAETIYALRDALATQAQQVLEAQRQLRLNPDSVDTQAALVEALTQHRAIQEVVQGTTAEAGRALRQFTQPVEGSIAALQQLQNLATRTGQSVGDLAQNLAGMDLNDPETLAKVSRVLNPPRLPPNEFLPTGEMPGQISLFDQQRPAQLGLQQATPGAGGLLEQVTSPAWAQESQDFYRQARQAEWQRQMADMDQNLQDLGLVGNRQSTQTIGGQGVLPGFQPGQPVSWADRLRLYHVGNVIGDVATLSKVAMNSMFNPAWSFATRGAADLLGGNVGRAQGSVIGMQSGLATWGQQFMDGFSSVYSRPSSLAVRETTPLGQMLARAWETPGALHNAFQSAGQNLLQQVELGRLAGQDVAARGLSGQAFIDEVSNLMANPRQGWLDSANGVARRAVLRGDLGTVGQMFANLAGQGAAGGPVQGARQVVGNALFPVFRIGMNALTQGVEKSPLGLLGTGVDVARATTPLGGVLGEGPYAAVAEGLGPSFERPVSSAVAPLSERLTNNIVGTAVTAAMAKLALDGTITGSGPSDPQQRQTLEAEGWQPNSIRTPVGYVSYQGTPLEVPLGLAGQYADVFNRPMTPLEMQQPVAATAAERLFAGTLDMLTSRTGLETLGQISDMIHGLGTDAPTAMRQFGTGIAANMLGGYVPMAGLLRGVARGTDPLMRQPAPGDVGAAIAQNIPVLRQQVQPRIDVLGQTVANPQAGLGALLPTRLGAGAPNPIAAAYERTNTPLGPAPQTIDYGPYGQVYLTPQQRQTWLQLRGQVLQNSLARTAADPKFQQSDAKSQELTLKTVDQIATRTANLQMLSQLGPNPTVVPRPGSLTAPVQSYAPGASNYDLMSAVLSNQTGLQALQAAQQQRDVERQAVARALLGF